MGSLGARCRATAWRRAHRLRRCARRSSTPLCCVCRRAPSRVDAPRGRNVRAHRRYAPPTDPRRVAPGRFGVGAFTEPPNPSTLGALGSHHRGGHCVRRRSQQQGLYGRTHYADIGPSQQEPHLETSRRAMSKQPPGHYVVSVRRDQLVPRGRVGGRCGQDRFVEGQCAASSRRDQVLVRRCASSPAPAAFGRWRLNRGHPEVTTPRG